MGSLFVQLATRPIGFESLPLRDAAVLVGLAAAVVMMSAALYTLARAPDAEPVYDRFYSVIRK